MDLVQSEKIIEQKNEEANKIEDVSLEEDVAGLKDLEEQFEISKAMEIGEKSDILIENSEHEKKTAKIENNLSEKTENIISDNTENKNNDETESEIKKESELEIIDSLEKELSETAKEIVSEASGSENLNESPPSISAIENKNVDPPEKDPDLIKAEKSNTIQDTPDDIINLLKLLSPEKLQEIKSKVLEITDKEEEKSQNTDKNIVEMEQKEKEDEPEKMEIQESDKPEIKESDKTEIKESDKIEIQASDKTGAKEEEEKMEVDDDNSNSTSNPDASVNPTSKDDDDVICLDSDDDDDDSCEPTAIEKNIPESAPEEIINKIDSPKEPPEIAQNQINEETIDLDDDVEQAQNEVTITQKLNNKHVNGDAPKLLKLKECINPLCPRNPNDDYTESSSFALSVYHIIRKPNKYQWICTTCFDNAIEIYEKLASNLYKNESWLKIKIPKKQDLVEIIDSDEETNDNTTTTVPESQMIIFTKETEKEMEDIITELTSRVDFNYQIEAEEKQLEKTIEKTDKELENLNEAVLELERKSYKMYCELYSINRPTFQRRPSLDLETLILTESGAHDIHNSVKRVQNPHLHNSVNKPKNVNAVASLIRSSTPGTIMKSTATTSTATTAANVQAPSAELSKVDKIFYAVRLRGVAMPHWMPCRITENLTTPQEKKFKVKFCDSLPNSTMTVSGKEISFGAPSEKLEIGARVIALFPRSMGKNRTNLMNPQKRFLPGVIGEKLTQHNKRRYLVFCDYGQVKYCPPNEVREIQDAAECVWEDVHENLRQFIRDYLESKTNRSRALLNVRLNTQIMTERSGKWNKTVVQEVDCSLVRVHFPEEQISEWLYRGSKRFYTMFQQAQRTQSNIFQRRNDPAISYITIDDDEEKDEAGNEIKRNIAKKSTSSSQVTFAPTPATTENQKIIILNDSNIYLEEPAKVCSVRHYTPKKEICAKKYVAHDCTDVCVPPLKNNLISFAPLAKPLLTCWERQILRHKNTQFVIYKAPCGRQLRNYIEVFKYIGLTKCFLNIEHFDFDPSMQVLAQLMIDQKSCGLFIPDISEGKEGMKVQCINAFDDQRPPPLNYSPHRNPMPGVNINTDPEFMSCCDCTDECYDKSKCACFQLTIRGAKYKNLMEEDEEDISYVWKRLLTAVPTGIYECNSRCKCSKRCLNRVVQHPIQVKMQLYRTKQKGWGLQSLHDIPKGTFICIYAGNLYLEKDANALCQGLDHGDEYFAELDLIENAEARKEGYESGIVNPDDSDEKDSDSDYDDTKESNDYEDGDFVSKSKDVSSREIVTRSLRTSLRGEKSKSSSSTPQRTNSEDSSDDEMVNMMPNTLNSGALLNEGMRLPFRKLYGPKEKAYIMDAKQCGNVGRYFNHSCDPTLFVQSVCVDTHDLRFPWIAFFAQRAIKAGEELTWNYNYEVGSVPSKVLYCKCGSVNCRGRIL